MQYRRFIRKLKNKAKIALEAKTKAIFYLWEIAYIYNGYVFTYFKPKEGYYNNKILKHEKKEIKNEKI